jgi:hypothetical protein
MPFTLRYAMPLVPFILGFVALAFIGIGLYALIRRRPFAIDGRWMIALMVVVFLPQILIPLSSFFFDGPSRNSWSSSALLIEFVAMVVVLGFAALTLRGYMVFGSTRESFQDAVRSALSSLHLESREALSTTWLPSVPAELEVAVHWLGTGQLRLRGRGRPGLLADIGRGMNAYFNMGEVKTDMTSAVVYVVAGVLMCAGAVTFLVSMNFPPFHTLWQ